MPYPSMDKFLSYVQKHNDFANASRFRVYVVPPADLRRPDGISNSSVVEGLAFQCEIAELPARNLSTADIRYYGPRFKTPYQTEFQDITLNFFCMENMWEKRLFDAWMSYIQDDTTYDLRYADQYSFSDITIEQYDKRGNIVYKSLLTKAFPISVNQINLAWNEENVPRLSVVFAYTRCINLIDREVIRPQVEDERF